MKSIKPCRTSLYGEMIMSERIRELLKKMTLDEKIGQLNQVKQNNSEELKEDIKKGQNKLFYFGEQLHCRK